MKRLEQFRSGELKTGVLARVTDSLSASEWNRLMEQPWTQRRLFDLVLEDNVEEETAFRSLEVLLCFEPKKLPYQVNLGRSYVSALGYEERWREMPAVGLHMSPNCWLTTCLSGDRC